MQQAYLHLIKFALDNGHTISVYDGEEYPCKYETSYIKIKDAIESVEEAQLFIFDKYGGHKTAWVLVSAYGLQPDETVMDYSDNQFMQDWDAKYERDTARA
jgi:hypothetical protein